VNDPTTLNPAQQADQVTAYALVPACVRCGHQGFSRRRDGVFRCDGCVRVVATVEYAPRLLTRTPLAAART